MPHPARPLSVFSACAHWTTADILWGNGGLSRSHRGGEKRARGEVAAYSHMLVHPVRLAIKCAQGASGDITHPYVRRPVHSSSRSGASTICTMYSIVLTATTRPTLLEIALAIDLSDTAHEHN